MKTPFDVVVDVISSEMNAPAAMVRPRVQKIFDALDAKGIRLVESNDLFAGASASALPANPAARASAKLQDTDVSCPRCGSVNPQLLFKGEQRELPDGSKVVVSYVCCAAERCHAILSVAAIPEAMLQRPRVQ